MMILFFFVKDIVQGNADLAEHLIEILVDRDDVLAVRYWSKNDPIDFRIFRIKPSI